MDPQQKIFTEMLTRLRTKGHTVYDGTLPSDGAAYPFIYMGDSQIVDTARKGVIQGTVYQTIHVWHDKYRERGKLSDIVRAVKQTARQLEHETGLNLKECSSQILPDNTTQGQPLMHGIIELGFQF